MSVLQAYESALKQLYNVKEELETDNINLNKRKTSNKIDTSFCDNKETSLWKSCREKKEPMNTFKRRTSAKPLINNCEYHFDLEDDNFYTWEKSLIKDVRREYNYPKIDENSKEIAARMNKDSIPAYIRLYNQSLNKFSSVIYSHS